MILRVAKFTFCCLVVLIWAVVIYAAVYRIAEDISFWKSMGGLP